MSHHAEPSDSDEYIDACEDPLANSSGSSDDSDWDKWEKINHLDADHPLETDTSHKPSTDNFDDELAPEIEVQPHNIKLEKEEARRKEEAQLSTEELEKRKLDSLDSKEQGNELFRSANYIDALEAYTKALDMCPLIYDKDRSIFFSNRAACQNKLGNIDAALADCDEALKLQPDYVKCLQRRAALREERDMLTDALQDYEKLVQLDPGNQKARWACMTLPDRIKKQQEEMKEKMLDQLKQLGNMVLKPFGLSTNNFKVEKKPDSEGYSINFVR